MTYQSAIHTSWWISCLLGLLTAFPSAGFGQEELRDSALEGDPRATLSGWRPTRVFGQPSLRETNYNEVVAARLFHPGGVMIDRLAAPQPSRVYVWDSGNNRILGFDHVGTCDGGAQHGALCTESSICTGGSCTADLDRPATVVVGQASGLGSGSCNRNNTRPAPASKDRICAIPYPFQPSPLEGPRGNSMAVDGDHNLYVVDPFNNRILRFDDPFQHDPRADWVWGQPNFKSRQCNQGRGRPSSDTLCTGELDNFVPNFYFEAGLDVTQDGSAVWIADLGNHRVLRVDTTTGKADLAIGQPGFDVRVPHCQLLATGPVAPGPAGDVRLCKPNSVQYDEQRGRLYVLHGDEHGRVYIYDAPLYTGMAPVEVYGPPAGSELKWPRGLTLDPFKADTLWLTDTDNSRLLQYVGGVPTRVLSKGDFTTTGCVAGLQGNGQIYPQVCGTHGTLGIDRDGSIYAGDFQEQHVERFPAPIPLPDLNGVAHSPDARLWSDGEFHPNRIGASGLANPGYLLVVRDQLVIADRRRILFWNDYASGGRRGGDADGVLAQPGFETQQDPGVSHHSDFTGLVYDAQRELLYAAHGRWITAWSTAGGLRSLQAPVFQIASPIALRGGGQLTFEARGLTIDRNDSAWIADFGHNRLLRVLDMSRSSREIDAVVGQPDLVSMGCNRGTAVPSANSFCQPADVKLDRLGNLYVVDGTWEGNGNQRVLQFLAPGLPPVPSPLRFWPTGGPMARRVFAKTSFSDTSCDSDRENHPCTPRFLSFEPGSNRMIMSVDAYGNPRGSRAFIYNFPTVGAVAPAPDGRVPLPFNQAAASDWDAAGRFVILDHTWNRALLVPQPPQPVCGDFNGDVSACDAASGCSYYFCSDQCHLTGTTNCDAGCGEQCE